MGASTYRDEEYKPKRRKSQNQRTPMEEVISKMTDAEARRKKLIKAKEGLADAENQFMEAEEEISKLDPESQRMLRAMLKKLNEKDKSFRDDER